MAMSVFSEPTCLSQMQAQIHMSLEWIVARFKNTSNMLSAIFLLKIKPFTNVKCTEKHAYYMLCYI